MPLTTLGELRVDAFLSHGARSKHLTWRRRAPAEGNAWARSSPRLVRAWRTAITH